MSTSNTSNTAVVSSHARTLRMVETGLLLAIATVLSVIQPYQLPFGGGITVASMLPIVLISYRHGVKWVTKQLQ